MGKRCSPATWKCSLLIGSVLTWTLGVVVFGLSLSTIRKPVFMPSVIPLVSTVYHHVVVALAGAILICLVAVVGCFGAACRKPCLLLTYAFGLICLWFYQVVVSISLLYEKTETFPYIQFLSIDICEYRKQQLRGRQGRLLSQEDLIESITRAEANARLFNRNVALLLEEQKAKGQATDCSPIRDFISPIAVVLLITSALYVYFGFCTVRLALHVWAEQKAERMSRRVKYERSHEISEHSASLSDDFLESLFGSPTHVMDTPNGRLAIIDDKTWSSLGSIVHSSSSSQRLSEGQVKVKFEKIPEPTETIPKREHRKSSTVSSNIFLTPRLQSMSSTSSSSFYSTPPFSIVPSIVLCTPTP